MNTSRNPFVRFPGVLFATFLFVIVGLIWQSTKVSIDANPMTLLESTDVTSRLTSKSPNS